MARRSWFRRVQEQSPAELKASARRVPADLAVKCPNRACSQILLQKELETNLKVCKKCGYHFRLGARERIELLIDEESFEPFEFGLLTTDPLEFPGYREKLNRHRANTGLDEAFVAGRGQVGGYPVVICVTDFDFIRGTMNSVIGEAIARSLDEATAAGLPAILISGSGGGARMEEGLLSLMQMAKTASSLAAFDADGFLSICILTDSTMAGVFASWASLGDIIFAEPGAMVGFTGERVAATVQTERVPDNFRTSEFNFEHGMIDQVVHRSQLKDTLTKVLSVIRARSAMAG
jgi:acetyl-CoA carboxylase carboxyl transferase subunit beta